MPPTARTPGVTPADGARHSDLTEHFADGRAQATSRALIEEAPVAIEINGLGYAVMMATPTDLEDYALGFCLSEGLIEAPGQVLDVASSPVPAGGWMLRITIDAPAAGPLIERARLRLSEGSCGLCGIESLEQVLRPLPALAPTTIDDATLHKAIFAAAEAIGDLQTLGRMTRAAHAAAFCDAAGAIVLLREDVGRHNAFDKLIGAMAGAGIDPASGFVLLTARCSFELVQKAVLAGVPVLATISAASTLAVDTAARAGLKLYPLVRGDSLLEA